MIKKAQETSDPQTKKEALMQFMNSNIQDPVVVETLWELIQSFSHSQVAAMISSFGGSQTSTNATESLSDSVAIAVNTSDSVGVAVNTVARNAVISLAQDNDHQSTAANQEFEYDKAAFAQVEGSIRLIGRCREITNIAENEGFCSSWGEAKQKGTSI